MSDWMGIGITILLLALNAFFVGAEFALVSARRSAIEPDAHAGSKRAKITVHAMEQVSLMMATAQLGITLASLGLGAIGEPALAHLLESPFEKLGLPENLLHPVSFVLAMSIVVFLHVVAGEMIPKNIALAGPDRAALWLGPPLVAISKVLKPFVVFLNWLANALLKLFKVEPKDEVESAFTREQVEEMVEESHREGLLDSKESVLLAGALRFDSQKVEAVMIPMSDVQGMRPSDTRRHLESIAAETGYSRLPVHDGDGFAGYVHMKDVLTADRLQLDEPVEDEAVRPLPQVPAGEPARIALEVMQAQRAQLAQVVDAEGRAVGIVAMEDVLGRLVGAISSESQDSAE